MLRTRLLAPLLAIALGAFALGGCGDDDEDGSAASTETTGTETTTSATKPARHVPPSKMPNSLAGDWTGELRQKGLAPFEVAVRIDPAGPTYVAYTGIDCGGYWVLRLSGEDRPPIFVIDEVINQGAGETCKGHGTVSLKPRSKTEPYTELDYSFEGEGVLSRGVLRQTDEAGLDAVFTEAGVTPPG